MPMVSHAPQRDRDTRGHVVAIQVEGTEEAVTWVTGQEDRNLGRGHQGSQREAKEQELEGEGASPKWATGAALRADSIAWVS